MRSLLFCALFSSVAAAQNTLVITPDEFRPALKEWTAYREAQGHKITVRAPAQQILETKRDGFDFILLLGDVKQVPCTYVDADIIRRWEREPKIATDNHLADLDGDGLPDVALGRLPADTPEEAAALLRKSIEYEKNRDYSTWRRRINVVAGVGGFGKLQDALIERAATHFLSTNIPYSFDLHVTYANPNSPFCPPPWDVRAITLRRFNEGAFFLAYLGHGSVRRLDSVRFKQRRYRIFDEDDAYELKSQKGAPLLLLSCCSSGHLDAVPDCLAEVMIKQPKGPVAIIASSRVSMPYGNGVLAKELMTALFEDRLATIGEVVARAKVRSMKPKPEDKGRQFIELLAFAYEPDLKKRARERQEHVYLYNLIGDPTLRVAQLGQVVLEAAPAPGGLGVKGTSPVDGRGFLEVVTPRKVPDLKRAGDTPEDFRKTYKLANTRVVLRQEIRVSQGRFSALLKVTGPAPHFLRAFVEGRQGAATGWIELKPK